MYKKIYRTSDVNLLQIRLYLFSKCKMRSTPTVLSWMIINVNLQVYKHVTCKRLQCGCYLQKVQLCYIVVYLMECLIRAATRSTVDERVNLCDKCSCQNVINVLPRMYYYYVHAQGSL